MTKKTTTNSTLAALRRTSDEKETTQFYLFSITCSAFDTLSLSLCMCAYIACMQMHAQEDRQTITCEAH